MLPPPAEYPAGRWVPAPDGKSYVQVPPGYEAPPVLPYEEGRPIPTGYLLVERPRTGLVVPGFVLSGTGYGAAAIAAMAGGFANESVWLLIPWIGPWLTLGLRDYEDCNQSSTSDPDAASEPAQETDANCTEDALAISGLIVDGMVQTAGGTLLLLGYTLTRHELVRSDYVVSLAPLKIAGGYGILARAAF